MATNERCDKIEIRLDALIAEFQRRTELRDAEAGKTAENFADISARVIAVEKAIEIAAAAAKPPNWWQILSAIGVAIGILATVGQSLLRPLESEVANLKEWRGEQLKDVKDVREKQYAIRQTLSEMHGEMHQIGKQLDAVDNRGSRKWIAKED